MPSNSWGRSYLGIHIADDGRTYLSSDYYGDDWIFHDHMVVRIGERVLRSETIPSYDPANHRFNGSGSVWETVSYTAGRDGRILEAIAADLINPIRVRLEGDREVKDFVIAPRDRAAIRAGYALGRALQALGPTRR